MNNRFLTPLINFVVLIALSSNLAQARFNQCLGLYDPDASTINIGPTLSRVADKLESSESDILTAIAKLDYQEVQDLKEQAKELSQKLADLSVRKSLTQDFVEQNIKKIINSGFLMSAFHERLIGDLFKEKINPEGSITDPDTAKKASQITLETLQNLKGTNQADLALKHSLSEQLVVYLKELLSDAKYSTLTTSEKLDFAKKLKSDLSLGQFKSAKKITQMLDALSDVLKETGGPDLLIILTEQSMYDIFKILHTKKSGSGTKIVGGTTLIAPMTISMVGLFPLSVYFNSITTWTEGLIVLGSAISFYGFSIFTSNKIKETTATRIGSRVLAAPKEASVNWRRWAQRWTAKSKAKQTVAKNNSEDTQLPDTNLEESVFVLINRDLNDDFNDSLNFATWGSGLSKGINQLLKKEAEIVANQGNHAEDLQTRVLQLAEKNLSKQERAEIIKKSEELAKLLSQTLMDLSNLSYDLLVISYAHDRYTEKINQNSLEQKLGLASRLLPNKKQVMQANQAILEQLALALKTRTDTVITALQSAATAPLMENLELWSLR